MSDVIFCTVRACGKAMEARTDGMGRVTLVCPGCDRFARGLCIECPKPRARRSRRCAECGAARSREIERTRDRDRAVEHYHRNIASMRRRGTLKAFRARKRAYIAAWREENPHDAAGRAYMRWYMRKRRQDPAYRDRQNARKRELRALKKTQRTPVETRVETPVMERAA